VATVGVGLVVALLLAGCNDSAPSGPGETRFAYANDEGLVVVNGAAVTARYPKPQCPENGGNIVTDPTWTHDARFVVAVALGCYTGYSSNSADRRLLVIDTVGTGQREIICGCSAVAAVDGARVAWVDQRGRAVTADLASAAVPQELAIELPEGLWPYQAVVGVDGTFLLHATGTPPGRDGYDYVDGFDGGVVAVVAGDGSVAVLREYEYLETVLTAAAAKTADGSRYAFTTLDVVGDCGHPGDILVSDLAGTTVVSTDTSALGDGETFMFDAWWGFDGKLYATLMSNVCDPSGGEAAVEPSLWRLEGNRWVVVDEGPLNQVRQLSSTLKVMTVESGLYVHREGADPVKIAEDARLGAPPLLGAS
jgi:hypothetical protein